jgi:hypothetical protein
LSVIVAHTEKQLEVSEQLPVLPKQILKHFHEVVTT